MRWYRDRTHSPRTWPHVVLQNKLLCEGEIAIKRSGSTVQRIDLEKHSKRIDLVTATDEPWDTLKIQIGLSFDEEENQIGDVCNSEGDAVASVFVNCDTTKFQYASDVQYVSPVTWMEFELIRRDIHYRVTLEPMVLLNKSCEKDPEEAYAYKKGSVLATAPPVEIVTDLVGSIFGGRIRERYERFDGKIRDALYRFTFEENAPTIYWNTRYMNIISVIQQPLPEGTNRTLMRDYIIRSIASSIAYEMMSGIDPDAEAETDSIEFEVLQSIGKILGTRTIDETKVYVSGAQDIHAGSDVGARIQSYFRVGSILEKLIVTGGREDAD